MQSKKWRKRSLLLVSSFCSLAYLHPAGARAQGAVNAAGGRKTGQTASSSKQIKNIKKTDAVYSAEGSPEAITISASRRRQSTHDVANSVTVLTGASLEARGAQAFQDYISQIPGATLSASIPGYSAITFRGVATTAGIDQGQGTTGYFLNDIPLTDPGFAVSVPDIDTFDVARIEALKGPQSTLFGSATLGGAIDYIPNQANVTKWDAAGETSIVGMPGHEVGYGEKGMVNIPIIKGRLAVRGVLDYRQDPGYITNLGIGKNTNTTYTRNARVSVVFTPTDGTKLAYTYLGQSTDVSDDPYSMSEVYGAYTKKVATLEPVRTQTQMHELRLDQDLGFASLTAIGAFLRKGQSASWDYTRYYGALFPTIKAPTIDRQSVDGKSMYYELRLTSKGQGPLSWLIGAAYYETWKRVNSPLSTAGSGDYLASMYGSELASQLAPGGDVWQPYDVNYNGVEKSIFGEISYKFLHDFTLTGGARVFGMSEKSSAEVGGLGSYLAYGSLFNYSSGRSSQTSALPKFAFKYEPDRHIMAYFQFSEGYRFGAPNTNPVSAQYPTPRETKSDSLKNYEVGARLNFFRGHLILEPTLYYIDWRNLQAKLARPDGVGYEANVGRATSRGFEFAGTWVTPLPGLTLQSNATYTDAHMTEAVNLGNGVVLNKGTQLAASPKWQFSETLSYQAKTLFMRPVFSIMHHYQGYAPVMFGSAMKMGNYNTLDLRLSGDLPTSLGHSVLSIYVKNLTSSRGVTMGYSGGGGIFDQYYLVPPRLIGMTLAWHL
ncbi:TonB-dependent receptor [Acetobacter sacchari]|uniref:TonB-dependent receptor n=1 Tax=Acetobacter sacchari TaxID=2661687 RepID=UPI001FAEB471|nr:TonB-dependent receptor [Acetobacter sacchari]